MLGALAFGLSTDYGVFLLGRIKEAHDGGLPSRESVAVGLARTGRVVTSAAALFCIAIGTLTLSHVMSPKELGLGTASAVLLDAAVIRSVLVPALMTVLEDWNWRAPHRQRSLPRLPDSSAPGPAVSPTDASPATWIYRSMRDRQKS